MLEINDSSRLQEYAASLCRDSHGLSETEFVFAVERTRNMSMEQFQQEFWDEVEPMTQWRPNYHTLVHVTREGWKKMKEDPAYRERMMALLRRDLMGPFCGQGYRIVTVGGSEEEYRVDSWSTASDQKEEEDYMEKRRRRRKEFQKRYEKLLEKRRLERKRLERKRLEKYLLDRSMQERKRLELLHLEALENSVLYAEKWY